MDTNQTQLHMTPSFVTYLKNARKIHPRGETRKQSKEVDGDLNLEGFLGEHGT
jgi:hypothetical protein